MPSGGVGVNTDERGVRLSSWKRIVCRGEDRRLAILDILEGEFPFMSKRRPIIIWSCHRVDVGLGMPTRRLGIHPREGLEGVENCTANGFKPGTSGREGWHSPHDALVFTNQIISTYYGDGVRAVDISNPFTPVEVGYYIEKPVERIRWASYGLIGKPEMKPDGKVFQRTFFRAAQYPRL